MRNRPTHERRRGQRVPLSFHVEVSGVGSSGIPFCDHASAADISDRGCQIVLTREVRTGDLLTLRVVRKNDPDAAQESPFLYQAVWVEPTENGSGWCAGLAALEPGNPWRVNFPQETVIAE